MSVYHMDGKYSCGDAVAFLTGYLTENAEDLEVIRNNSKPKLYLEWVDRFFGDCMFPLELHEDEWRNNRVGITYILHRCERFLDAVGESSFNQYHYYLMPQIGDRFETDDRYAMIAHDMLVFFCVAYSYYEDYEEEGPLQAYLELAVLAARENLRYVFLESDSYFVLQGGISLHGQQYESKTEFWEEPLVWLYYEAQSGRYAKHLIPAYERYRAEIESLYRKASAAKKIDTAAAMEALMRSAESKLDALKSYYEC